MIPPGLDPPPALRQILLHARAAVEANTLELETFLAERLQDLRARYSNEPLGRFDRCLSIMLQKQGIFRPKPSFMYFPNLPAIEFFDRREFPWLDAIEAATDDIRAELVNVLADGPAVLDPYMNIPAGSPLGQWGELNHSRRWGTYYLWREGIAFPDHIARCPRTVVALASSPQWDVPLSGPTAVFSILDARTRIPAHTGMSNTRLVVHVPLIVPPGCGFRVGGETREWQPGHAFAFDDSIEHEAWNNSDEPRAVLIIDVWNPLLSSAERDLVRSLTAGVGEYYGTKSFCDE